MKTGVLTTLLVALFAFPCHSQAQQQDNDERVPLFGSNKSKKKGEKEDYSAYLAGAVPVVDGQVCFSQTFESGMKREEMVEALKAWAEKRFVPQEASLAKQATSPGIFGYDAAQGKLKVQGDEYIVFKDKALVLDQTRIYYTLSLDCSDGNCVVTMSRIYYDYNDTQSEETISRITAENQITDEYALRKQGTKLVRGTGTKFRVRTIDLKDDLFAQIQSIVE